MTAAESSDPEEAPATPPAKLDDVMLAMDVVDTLRHRERLVERELNADAREEQLIERLRDLYKSQGIEVPDSILAEGVKALEEDRFVYTPPKPGFDRTMAEIWVKRATYGKWAAVAIGLLVLVFGIYHFAVVKPRQEAAEAARIEITETLPHDLTVAHSAIVAEARVPEARDRADAILAQGQAALERQDAGGARAAVADLDSLAKTLQQEYVLRIAGRPGEDTGFFREHPSFQGRAYFIVVDAVDANGNPVSLPIRNDETNETETVSHFAVRVPEETFDAVRQDKANNGIVQNARLAEKRRGYLEPEYLMPTLPGRITSW
jgi:Family of unknown function (DUF6384)